MTTTTTTATPAVRFIKAMNCRWNGNGFGTSSADWVAFIGDVQVGHFDNDGRDARLFGQFWGFTNVTGWRRDIARFADRYVDVIDGQIVGF